MDTKTAAPVGSCEHSQAQIFQQIGVVTRELHDALEQLGVMPRLQQAAEGLPDARSRLNYIATKTASAANRVLNLVDEAKAEHQQISQATHEMARNITADPVRAVASGAMLNFVDGVEARTQRIDDCLTDIMLAQDFHDLTGQVIAKVVALAVELEASLVKLLLQAAPSEMKLSASTPDAVRLDGPQIDPVLQSDVVANQNEVDDLLASLGF